MNGDDPEFLSSFALPDIDGAFWFDNIIGESVNLPVVEPTPPLAPLAPSSGGAADDQDVDFEFLPPAPPLEGHTDDDPPSAPSTSTRRKRGRGRAKSNFTAEERRQKNREIQARYRAKQKNKKEEVEHIHSQVQDDLEKARGEQEIAKNRNGLLEQLITIRDATLSVLQRNAPSNQNPSDATATEDEEIDEEDASASMSNADASSSGGEEDNPSTTSSLPQPDTLQTVYHKLSSDMGAPVSSIADAYLATTSLQEKHNADLAVQCKFVIAIVYLYF